MRWEINRAKQADVKLKFATVRIESNNQKPDGLPNSTAVANGFTLQGIVNALSNANNYYNDLFSRTICFQQIIIYFHAILFL